MDRLAGPEPGPGSGAVQESRIRRILELVVCPECRVRLSLEDGRPVCPSCGAGYRILPWLGGGLDLNHPQIGGQHRQRIESHSSLIKTDGDWGEEVELDPDRLAGLEDYDYQSMLSRMNASPSLVFSQYYHDFTKELIGREIESYLAAKPRATILELACGHGQMASYLISRLHDRAGVTYLMTDIIEDSLKKSEAYYSRTGFHPPEGLLPFCCDGERLPLPGESVDIVFLMEAIEHFERPFAGFREFHRVLKPGGLCLITTPRPSQSWFRLRVDLLGRLFPYQGYAKHLMIDYSICDENFHRYIQENGFRELKRRFFSVNWPLANYPLLRLLHFPALVRLYAAFNLRILSRFFPLFRKAQFRVLEK